MHQWFIGHPEQNLLLDETDSFNILNVTTTTYEKRSDQSSRASKIRTLKTLTLSALQIYVCVSTSIIYTRISRPRLNITVISIHFFLPLLSTPHKNVNIYVVFYLFLENNTRFFTLYNLCICPVTKMTGKFRSTATWKQEFNLSYNRLPSMVFQITYHE